ncbi:MAG: RNA polymerase sigma factor [Porticoccaceae bacterium]
MKQELLELLPRLRRFAWSLTNAEHDADDLLQATVERVLRKGVPDNIPVDRWAFTVCRNLWIDEYRAQKVRKNAQWDSTLNDNQTVDGEREMVSHIELDRVNAAMKKLPEKQHMVLSMVAVEGLSYKHVATALDIPVGTVMSRLARARSRLVEMLELDIRAVKAGERS